MRVLIASVRFLWAACLVLAAGAGCSSSSASDGGTSTSTRDAGDLGLLGGQCAVECDSADDCCSGDLCGTSIFHYACETGRCRQLGCVADRDCSDSPGFRCASLGDFGACGKACRVPEDCCPPLPPGVVIPPGQDSLTVTVDGFDATFYRCGVYPQKFLCTGTDIEPDDAGTTGICLRYCSADTDCPGIPFPGPDGGTVDVRVDAGFVTVPVGGTMRTVFQQTCVMQFAGVGQCRPGCATAADCAVPGVRSVCVAGACVEDGCRGDAECSAGMCLPR